MPISIDVNQYGADPTGVVDSTAAIQAVIDQVCVGGDVRRASASVELSGRYLISSPLRVRSVMGFALEGRAGSGLIATAPMSSVLDLNGLWGARIGGIEISGTANGTVDRAIHLYWDQATSARSTTLNRLHNIDIHALNYVTGIELGRTGDGNQVDSTTLRDVSIRGGGGRDHATLWQHGLVVGDGIGANNLLHNAYGLESVHHRYNVDLRASQFAMFGGSFDGGEADIRAKVTSYLRVCAVRSENSRRLLVTDGNAGWASNATLEDITWRGEDIAADGEFIRWGYGGVLRANNVQVNRPGAPPKIKMHGTAPARLLVDGLSFAAGSHVPPSAADAFSLAANSRVTARGVTLTDSSGLVQSAGDYDSGATP